MDNTVLPANYTVPVFTPKPQSITALWLVLILTSHDDENYYLLYHKRCSRGIFHVF